MKHGEIKRKLIQVGSGHVYEKTIRYCAVHGEIDLFTCPDWDARHGRCDRSEQPAAVRLELPKTIAKAA
jgi:hypothetical protein